MMDMTLIPGWGWLFCHPGPCAPQLWPGIGSDRLTAASLTPRVLTEPGRPACLPLLMSVS